MSESLENKAFINALKSKSRAEARSVSEAMVNAVADAIEGGDNESAPARAPRGR